MKTKVFITAIAIALGSFLISTSASAQYVIKGIKCNDPPWIAHQNNSGSTQIVTLQIVRDGCRPKLNAPSGSFRYIVRWPTGSIDTQMVRQVKRTASKSRPVNNGYQVEVDFQVFDGARISGTFDYIITID